MTTAPSAGKRPSTSLSYLGAIVMFIGLSLLATAVFTIVLGEAEHFVSFLLPGLAAVGTGGLLYYPARRNGLPPLSVRDSMAIVVAGWIIAFLVSAWPFVLSGVAPYRLALFEAVSGWTTTGLSVMAVEDLPDTFLLWRSIMQYLGGAGFAIAMLASIIGPAGAGISRAEGREEVLPMVRQSASAIGIIYLSFGLVVTIGFRVFGMSWFDSVNHSMAALSTGGFSTAAESVGAWNNHSLEIFTIVAMMIGNTNFITHHHLIRGQWRQALHSPDVKVFAVAIVLAFGLLAAAPAFSVGLYDTVFQVISALSTTGFSTADLSTTWPGVGLGVLIVLMCIGGGINSTAGGLKQRRIYLMVKSLSWQIRESVLPRRAVVSRTIMDHGRMVDVDDDALKKVANFVILYLATLAAAALVIASYGYTLSDALFEAASAVGTVGLSVGITGPEAPALLLWVQKLAMFLGRLEFFAIIVAARSWLMSLQRYRHHRPTSLRHPDR